MYVQIRHDCLNWKSFHTRRKRKKGAKERNETEQAKQNTSLNRIEIPTIVVIKKRDTSNPIDTKVEMRMNIYEND